MTYKTRSLALLVCLFLARASHSADTAEQAVTQADASFWLAYNACDMEHMGELLTDDVEFYHDITGLTVSRSGVVDSLRKGPCKDPTSRLRRELVDGTLAFHPLAGGYALLSGQHRFYVNQPGKQEHLAGQAGFTTLYKLDDGRWRMHRILSYAHAAPSYVPPKSSLSLPSATLDKYAGQYTAEKAGAITVVREDDHLKLTAGKFVATLYPETSTRFFAKERDVRFEFEVAADGSVRGLAVYENGGVTERARRGV